jgi:uncharacterized protein (DUF305 family)
MTSRVGGLAPKLVVAGLVAATACRASATGGIQPSPAAASSSAAAIAKARADSARLPYTEADVHFMSGMIGHHTQAITISRWAPSHGANSSVRTLAERIINAQQDEITIMQQWLRDRLQPVPEPSPRGVKMTMHGMTHEMAMPGMLTDDQLKELDAARGPEFDRLFLTFMIQHHRGAIDMVKELHRTPGAAQDEIVFKVSNDVNVDQTTEIARMQKMLIASMTTRP